MDQPLTGERVLDLGQIYQGGYCGLILSYLGAEVIKVEPPWGEPLRGRSEDGKPPQIQYLNSTKKGIILDLKSEEGRDAFKKLIAESDVLLENFTPGKMEALGLGYETLSSVNSELIYAHGSGYGDYGPYSHYPAMDLTVQAMSGVMETTGFPDGPPVKAGPAVCDFLGGIHLVTGIVSALYQREVTGEGQYVEVGMLDCMYPTLASPVSSWTAERGAPPRTGNRHSGLAIAPYNAYEVEDGYVTILCITDRHWESLATTIEREEFLEKEKFSSKTRRAQHIDEIDTVLEEWLEGKSKDEVVSMFLDAEVPCAPVQTIEEIVEDPHLNERDMLNYLPNQGKGKSRVPIPGMPIKFSDSDEPKITQAPLLGEHTEEVLTDIAGYDQEEITRLQEASKVED